MCDDKPYTPFLTKEEAAEALDDVYDFQVDYIDRPDLGEQGPRQIPLTRGRHAALAIFNKLTHRGGLDVREITGYDVGVIAEIVDEATDIINAAFDVGDGPVTLDVAWELNTIHEEGKNWQVGYNADAQQFNYMQFNTGTNKDGAGAGMCSSDSLYDAIMTLRTAGESKND